MTILTSVIGKNEDLIPQVMSLYAKDGFKIADVTYGNGNFWKKIDMTKYSFFPSDINGKCSLVCDFKNLPYANEEFDMVIFDPPYLLGSSAPINEDLDNTYLNNKKGGWGLDFVHNLYKEGMVEAQRVLKTKGVLLVKCQDQVESGKNHFEHIFVYNLALELGFLVEDLFILTRTGVPIMRHPFQVHARKNHSYLWIFRKEN